MSMTATMLVRDRWSPGRRLSRNSRQPLLAALALALAPALADAQSAMGDYLGRSASEVARELGGRARFLDSSFRPRAAEELSGCIVWQSPLPGETLSAETEIEFLCPDQVTVPELGGLTVAAAVELCEGRCLALEIVPKCGDPGAAPAPAEMAMLVTTQCTPANTLVAPGHTVGVVAGAPPSDESDTNVGYLLLLMGALAAMALALSLIFYVRYVSARDELRILKSPRNGSA